MSEETKEKDHSVLYITFFAVVFIGVLLAVKSNENDKFEPIRNQLEEERKLMNIRVLD